MPTIANEKISFEVQFVQNTFNLRQSINIIQSFKSCYFTFISLQTIAANRTHRKNTEHGPVNSKTVILIQHFIHKQFINIIQNNKILQIVHSFEKHLNFHQKYKIWAFLLFIQIHLCFMYIEDKLLLKVERILIKTSTISFSKSGRDCLRREEPYPKYE